MDWLIVIAILLLYSLPFIAAAVMFFLLCRWLWRAGSRRNGEDHHA